MRKIGIFCAYFPPHVGGVERYTDKLSLALKRLGYELVIVTSNSDSLKNYEINDGRKIYRLPIHKIAKSRYPIPKLNSEYKQLIKSVEDEKIDYFIVNTRFSLTTLVGAKMGHRLGKPVMLIEHGTGHFTVNNRILDLAGVFYEHMLTIYLKRFVSRFYGVSKNCNNWLGHFGIKGAGVFHNAIEVADLNSVQNYYKDSFDDAEVVLSYAGRLIKEKGILNLLAAFEKLKEENPDRRLRLMVAGDGPLLEYIKTKYSDASIDILGRLDFQHILALFKRSDIFVYPTLYPEGLPTSILEAGLMECAVIATPKGGTEEVIIDNRHGIIVDGTIKSLHDSIEQLLENSEYRKKLGTAIKSRVKTSFNWDVVAKEVDREIRSI